MMGLRAVVFDLFHTLTGPEDEWSYLPWTSDVLGIDRDVWNELLITRSRWRLTGEETDPYTIVRTLAHEIDPTIPGERIREATRCRMQRFSDSLTRIPPENIHALHTIRAAGLRTALISNADVMEVAAWPESPLAAQFDVEVFSCVAGCVKPERAIYERCLQALNVRADEAMFVGDGGANELVGAKDVGMTTVFMSGVMATLWPDRVAARRSACDHHIERIPELLDLLGLTSPAADEAGMRESG
ncbi:MAG TPA: HAD family hydrolase [Vicinamibacterales bacterium]|jgi:putative hydrolase of the HAD superfamily|nr:HAD family hydrolase [Vicinamibacterales bacterium]